jgi:MscS family membrane protein
LRGLPVTERGAKGPVLAKELEELLDRNVAFDPGSLSRNPGFSTGSSVREIVATLGDDGPADEVYVERIELRPQRLVWQFSADSVALISRLYQRSGQSEFEKRLPGPLVNWVFLDTSLWRWLVLLLLTVVLSALASILARGLLRLVRLLFSRVAFHLHAEFIEALVGPLRLIVIVVGFRAALEFIGPSALLRFYLGRGLSLLLAVGAAWLGMDLIDVATDRFRLRTAATPGDLRSSALPLMNKTVKIAIFVFAVTAILSSWGYDTTTVVAGVGVGGLAVALAAQKTIENLFGGMAVLSDRQVLVGDYCKFGDRTGTVEEIGLRSTRVRTLERTLVTVPNAQFSAMTLENFSRRDRTWFHPRLSLTRETSSAQIRHVLDAVSSVLASNNKVEP